MVIKINRKFVVSYTCDIVGLWFILFNYGILS